MQPANFLKPSKSPQSLIVRHQQETKVTLDVNTNVQNNVILYKYERDKYFWTIRVFAFGQLFGWSMLALYTYTPEFFDIFKTDIKFKEFLKEHVFRFGTFVFSIFAGKTFYFFFTVKIYFYMNIKFKQIISLIIHAFFIVYIFMK